MKNIDFLSTLFVGIDVGSKENAVCAMDFHKEKYLSTFVENSQTGAIVLADTIFSILENSNFKYVVIALESTSYYGVHLATFLSSNLNLSQYNGLVFCINPKLIANYKKSFNSLPKTDKIDAFIIADYARVGRIDSAPWRGSQFLALKRLTRHRLHLTELITKEKNYVLNNIFLKFSKFAASKKSEQPFSNKFGATAMSIISDFTTTEDLVAATFEQLVDLINVKSKKQIANPEEVATILKKAARDSYKLDRCLYEPINIAIASSFNCLETYEREIKTINKAIEKAVKGLVPNEYKCLLSIPGIGPVFAGGILAEIGTIEAFNNHNAIAKYAGIVWNMNQSSDFESDNSKMSKAGNTYLRYYLIEATNSVRTHIPEYKNYYNKKFNEALTHQHKRALAITSRKFIRLIFGLLDKNQLYAPKKVDA